MMNKPCIFIILVFSIFVGGSASLQAQTTMPEKAPAAAGNFKPQFDGAVKTKVEMSTYDGDYRFDVRSTRFGMSGNVNPNVFYKVQVDFSNEGKFSVLDAYVGYKSGNFDVMFGQQPYRFSTDISRSPANDIFANRSFLAKFITSYSGEEISGGGTRAAVKTLGSRDLGAIMSYTIPWGLPLKIYAGVFNGSGINNPEWGDKANVIGRLELGAAEGFRTAVSYYTGSTPTIPAVHYDPLSGSMTALNVKDDLEMIDAELRYAADNFLVEAEYAQRTQKSETVEHTLVTGHVQGYYKFRLPDNNFAAYIAPALRWDIGDNIDYYNTETLQREGFSANRITAGLNLGFPTTLFRSELRINFEKYIVKNKPSDFAANKLLHDKVTLEMVVAF